MNLGPVCDICGKPTQNVFSSGLGAYSTARCDECLATGLEPVFAVETLLFCIPYGDLRPDYQLLVDQSLEAAGVTLAEVEERVHQAEEEYAAWCEKEVPCAST